MTVTVTGPPAVAEALAVSVSTLELVVAGFGLKLAVTPAGRPLAERLTFPLNPLAGVMVIVSVLLAPWVTESEGDCAASEKVGAAFTVTATVVVSESVPDVPVMVTVTGPPVVALPLAVSVSTLEPLVVGFGLKLAVTPVGRPLAASVTPLLNPFAGVTVMESVAVLP